MIEYTIHGECPAVSVSWHACTDERRTFITGYAVALTQNDATVSIDSDKVEELVTALRFAAALSREIELQDVP